MAAAAAGNNIDPELAVWFGDPSSPQQQEEEEEVVNLSPQQYQLLMDLMDVMEDSGLVGESGDRDKAASDDMAKVDNYLAGYDDAVLGLKDEGAQDEKLGSERGVGSPGKRSGSNLSMQLSMSVLRDMLRTNTRHRLSKLNAIG